MYNMIENPQKLLTMFDNFLALLALFIESVIIHSYAFIRISIGDYNGYRMNSAQQV